MITVNRPMYVLISRGVNKNRHLTIDIRLSALDKICTIEIPIRMLEPDLAHLLRWYLPDNIPPCELANMQSQINTIRNKLVESLSQYLPAETRNH